MTVRYVTNISVPGQGWVALGNEFFWRSAGTMETLGQVRATGCFTCAESCETQDCWMVNLGLVSSAVLLHIVK